MFVLLQLALLGAAALVAATDDDVCTEAQTDALTLCGTTLGMCASSAGSDEDSLCDCVSTYDACIREDLCGTPETQKAFLDALDSAADSYHTAFGCNFGKYASEDATCTAEQSDALSTCGTDFGSCVADAETDTDKLCDCLGAYDVCIRANLCGPEDFRDTFKDALDSAAEAYHDGFGCAVGKFTNGAATATPSPTAQSTKNANEPCTDGEAAALSNCGTSFAMCATGITEGSAACACFESYQTCINANLCGSSQFRGTFASSISEAREAYNTAYDCNIAPPTPAPTTMGNFRADDGTLSAPAATATLAAGATLVAAARII